MNTLISDPVVLIKLLCTAKKLIFRWELVLDNQIGLLQNFALLLQNFALLLQIFALLLQIFALLQSFALLFGINCTEIDQSQSSIISVYIINVVIQHYVD